MSAPANLHQSLVYHWRFLGHLSGVGETAEAQNHHLCTCLERIPPFSSRCCARIRVSRGSGKHASIAITLCCQKSALSWCLASGPRLRPPGILCLPPAWSWNHFKEFKTQTLRVWADSSCSQMVHTLAAPSPLACSLVVCPLQSGDGPDQVPVDFSLSLPSFTSVVSYGFLCFLLSPWGGSCWKSLY